MYTPVVQARATIAFGRPKTDPEAGAKGVSAFLLPLDSPGVARVPYADMGAKGIVRGSMFLTDVEVPAENLIGPENAAFSRVMQTFEYTRGLIGRMCIGAAQVTLEEKPCQMATLYGYGRVLKDELPTPAWKTAASA